MNIVRDKHPSYGMLQFCRTTGSPRALFGSSIQHGDTITMYLREGESTGISILVAEKSLNLK